MDINTFFTKVVFGWIKRDLERMMSEVQVKPGEAGNINFPLTLCTLAYMEFLGGFLKGRKGNFIRNASYYIQECFRVPQDYPAYILKDLFRNGLAHEYFSRAGISRDGIRPPLYRREDEEIILDAQTLVIDFLESLEKFREKLNSDNYISRLKLAEHSIKEARERHKGLIASLPIFRVSTTTTTTSGASGYPGPINSKTTTTLPYDPNEK